MRMQLMICMRIGALRVHWQGPQDRVPKCSVVCAQCSVHPASGQVTGFQDARPQCEEVHIYLIGFTVRTRDCPTET